MTKILSNKTTQLILFFLSMAVILFLLTSQGFTQPFYWDTEWFLIGSARLIAQTGNIFSYLGASDYPHTFLLPLTIAFIFKMPVNHLLFIHLWGFLLSVFFLIIMYFLGAKLVNRKTGMALALLFLTNPLFLAQTQLVYLEIIGTALRFLAVIFLLKKKYLLFTLIAVLAILTRIDNSIFLILAAFIYLLCEKKITNKFDWTILYISPLFLITAAWLKIHAQIAGWWIYSPQRYFEEQPWQSLWDAVVYITISQGRYVISGSILIMALTRLKTIFSVKNKKLSVPALILAVVSLPTLLMIAKLGYFLPRYIFPILPVFYLLFLVALQKLIKNPIIFWVIIILIIIIQYQYRFDCYAGNFEDCLLVTDVLKNKF